MLEHERSNMSACRLTDGNFCNCYKSHQSAVQRYAQSYHFLPKSCKHCNVCNTPTSLRLQQCFHTSDWLFGRASWNGCCAPFPPRITGVEAPSVLPLMGGVEDLDPFSSRPSRCSCSSHDVLERHWRNAVAARVGGNQTVMRELGHHSSGRLFVMAGQEACLAAVNEAITRPAGW
jgi:hypothetical protein